MFSINNLSSVRTLLLAASLVALSTTAAAQRPGGSGGNPMTDVEVGSAAPDLKVFDANGQERSLRDLLKGQTTAIVFGCLT